MYCRLLLKLILRDRAVWISTLVLAAAFSVPIAFNSPIFAPFFMKQGMQSFVDAFNTRATQANGNMNERGIITLSGAILRKEMFSIQDVR